jgi:hypothetical protein
MKTAGVFLLSLTLLPVLAVWSFLWWAMEIIKGLINSSREIMNK